jgi:hypothetical protein
MSHLFLFEKSLSLYQSRLMMFSKIQNIEQVIVIQLSSNFQSSYHCILLNLSLNLNLLTAVRTRTSFIHSIGRQSIFKLNRYLFTFTHKRTRAQITFEHFYFAMSHQMLFHVGTLTKCFSTKRTKIGLFICVSSNMVLQC